MSKLEELYHQHGDLAGEYDLQWKGDYRYRCNTGHLQLAILAFRINRPEFGSGLIKRVLPAQILRSGRTNFGGLPGSTPAYGPYMRLKYPNWGLKFLLDALEYTN